MSMLTILRYPDERLRSIASPVEHFDPKLHRLIDDMLETMYAAPGIGLAATQIDVHKQLLVIDISEGKNQPLVLINPEILAHDGCQKFDEGCLSVPGIYESVERAMHIRLRACNRNGKSFEMEAEDLLAVCIQHEMDHLQGKLFVDYLSSLKRQRIRKKLQKQEKQAM
ncbi:Peptide deformylase [hydrothermal vent metagenome]|uniref:Peptide deformylase n=1 Tax=hydrothermal vent metagenome TaxID=652676 RepID=A0A3B1BIK2_9ZZZZ